MYQVRQTSNHCLLFCRVLGMPLTATVSVSVSVTFCCCAKKKTCPKATSEERVYFVLLFQATVHRFWGKSVQEVKAGIAQRPWRMLFTDLLPMVYSVCFPIEPRTTYMPRMSPSHSGLYLPHQPSILWKYFLNSDSIFPDTTRFVSN